MNADSELELDADDPLAGDPQLRRDLAAMFLEDCPKLLLEIRAAISRRDGWSLKIDAHTLKGSVRIFKAQSAVDAALRMEHIGKDCAWDHSEEAWTAVRREMDCLMTTLASETEAAMTPTLVVQN